MVVSSKYGRLYCKAHESADNSSITGEEESFEMMLECLYG